MNIDGARILVTGGAGLIGSTTIDLLLRGNKPEQIVILDNLERGTLSNIEGALADPRVKFVRGDIADVQTVRNATQGMDAVIHMAALRITACAADPRKAMQVMCNGSFNVVEAAQEANVGKIVAASTASIYGLADTFPTREDHHPYNNNTWYGASKVMLEGLLHSYRTMSGLPYVALRYFNVYGPRMDLHGKYTEVLVRWMERIAEGKPPLIFGDGKQTMDFVCVPDIARANVLAAEADVTDRVYNIASNSETSLKGLAEALLRTMGSELDVEHGPERAVNGVTRRLADISAAERDLGWKPEIGLEDGLAELVEWWQAEKAQGREPALVGSEAR